MPSVPKWIGNAMEAVFTAQMHTVRVTETVMLSKRLKKVRLEGDLQKTKFFAGNVIEFRVNDTDYRHYTPSLYDAQKGVCEVWFYLHDHGPGSRWAADLTPGDTFKLLGPGGRLKYDNQYTHHFLFGDETSAGWFHCMENAIKQNGHSYFGLIELDSENAHWLNDTYIPANIVLKTDDKPAFAAIEMLKKWADDFWTEALETCFYLTGSAKSIQAFKKMLVTKGIPAKQIKTEPYWVDGKKGL